MLHRILGNHLLTPGESYRGQLQSLGPTGLWYLDDSGAGGIDIAAMDDSSGNDYHGIYLEVQDDPTNEIVWQENPGIRGSVNAVRVSSIPGVWGWLTTNDGLDSDYVVDVATGCSVIGWLKSDPSFSDTKMTLFRVRWENGGIIAVRVNQTRSGVFTSDYIDVDITDESGNYARATYETAGVFDDTWHFVAVTMDPTNKSISVVVDDTELTATSTTSSATAPTNFVTLMDSAVAAVSHSTPTAIPGRAFYDDIAWFSGKKLTVQERQNLYATAGVF